MIRTRSRQSLSHIKRFVASNLLLVVLSPTIASQPRPPASRVALPNYIVENRGVYASDVAYYLIGRTKSLFFTRGGMTVQL